MNIYIEQYFQTRIPGFLPITLNELYFGAVSVKNLKYTGKLVIAEHRKNLRIFDKNGTTIEPCGSCFPEPYLLSNYMHFYDTEDECLDNLGSLNLNSNQCCILYLEHESNYCIFRKLTDI